MDRNLVTRAQRGDREAFAVLVHQVSDSLFAVGFRILRPAWSPAALRDEPIAPASAH